jgi:hypothetical protein
VVLFHDGGGIAHVTAYQRPKPEGGERESILTIWLWVPYGTIGGIFFPTLSNEMFGLGVI